VKLRQLICVISQSPHHSQKESCRNVIRQKIVGLITAFVITVFLVQNVYAVQTANHANDSANLNFTDRIIVKYKPNSRLGINGLSRDAVDSLSVQAGHNLRGLRRMATGANVMKLDRAYKRDEIDAIVKRLNTHPDVEYAEPDLIMKPLFVPNDTYYGAQWHYFESTGGINLESAWDVSTGAGAIVAVLDTGYTNHVDLAANLLPGYDMISDAFVGNDGDGRDSDASDPGDWVSAGACGNGKPSQDLNSSWHGTHVAGTIAAVTDNNTGVAGVAFNAKVVPVRVLGRCGGYTSDIADGIIWAAGGSVSGVPDNPNPAQVINMSLGGTGSCGTTTQNAIDTARALGTTVVVAAGNENVDASNATPANCNGVVAVAATARSGGRAFYSNYGSVVDVAAPGGDLSTNAADGIASTLTDGLTTPGNDIYVYYQGTSMASPHVAGIAALLYAQDPTLAPDEVETILKDTTRAFPATCNQCGTGIVDAAAALAALNNPPLPPPSGGGFTIDDLSGSRRSWQYTTVDIPANTTNLSVSISGGSGDADLYVRYGSKPSTWRFDCRPYQYGNNETCSFDNPTAGTWHIGIRGYSAYSGVTWEVSYE
jgi:serine protease